jgi:hypothetical protein
MTNEHDKEIDSLLRRLAKTDAAYVSESSSGAHIDADELSVFAENSLPERARTRVIAHIADCGRCRTIASNLISLNSAAAKAASTPEVSAGRAIDLSIPWYRKLFAVRGLAVAMGAVVILLAGFFAVFVIRNMSGGAESVAQMANTNVAAPSTLSDDRALNSSDVEGPAVEETAEATPSATPFPGRRGEGSERAEERSNAPATPPGRELAKEDRPDAADKVQDAGRRDQEIGNPSLLRKAPPPAAKRAANQAERAVPMQASPPPPQDVAAVGETEAAKAKTLEDDKDERAKPDVATAAGVAAEPKAGSTLKRQISGKLFNQKGGVWYDSAYSGQRTINVRRKTAEYRALESGLRAITDKLSGTVVIVWKAKAYRVD